MLTAGRMRMAAAAPRDPPVLTSPTDVQTGPTTGYGTVVTDTPTGTLYAVATTSSTPPTATQVKAGQDHSGSSATWSGNQTVAGAGTYEVTPTGLTELTAYTIHYMHEVSGRQSAVVSGDGFTTPSSDMTAPTLSSAVVTNIASTFATVGCTTNEGNGTVYWVVTTSSTAPTATQVKAGQDHTGAAVATGKKGSWAAPTPSGGAQTGSATGLSASTNHWAYFMHEDAVGNKSTVLSSSSFTTNPAVTPGSQTFNANGTFTVPSFNTLTVHVYGGAGAGGGGGINSNFVGGDGSLSKFASSTAVIANGGKGGQGRDAGGDGGAGGTTSGGGSGSSNGDRGDDGTATGDPSPGYAEGGVGGDCPGPDGGAGGYHPTGQATSGNYTGIDGTAPGGGGEGGCATGPGGGGGGGSGGYATKTFTLADLTIGASISITVGAGGAGGAGWRTGGDGAKGRVVISWS